MTARLALRRAAALCTAISIWGALVTPSRACIGDCNGDGIITISELVEGVAIALGLAAPATCAAFGDSVTISELVAAVNALLGGCPPTESPTIGLSPTGSPTIAPPPSGSPTMGSPTIPPTPTPTINQPPLLPTAFIYRALSGFDIELPIGAVDPEGGPVQCTVGDLPAGATFDPGQALFSWMPTADQLGPFYVPFTCTDQAEPPASTDGQLTFGVAARDTCAIPNCDPAVGCTATLPPATQMCCSDGPAARVVEPAAGCPAGRVLYIGRNAQQGFGRLQNCDVFQLLNMEQSSARAVFHIETRCLNTLNKVTVTARMDSNSQKHPIVFNTGLPPLLLNNKLPNGFAAAFNLRFDVSPPKPYTDLQGSEANLSVTVKDSDGVSVSTKVRVLLTFTPIPDLPDVDPTFTPLPTCAVGVTPGPNQTPPCGARDTPTPTAQSG
jgi:hypothetical protein